MAAETSLGFVAIGLNKSKVQVSYVFCTFAQSPVMTCLLVVEDDIDVRELVCEFLRDSGYDVLAAGSAQQARNLLASKNGRPSGH